VRAVDRNPEDTQPIPPEYERRLCRMCGAQGQHHRAIDGKCPSMASWGRPKPFPRWPPTIRDEAKAGRLYDTRLARYWARGRTWFRPQP
jgi:hypothetical protein